jgi:serine/threonine-protein kinase
MREGDTFDRYRIEGVLGEGGMGVVYRAFDPRLNRRVALKVVRAEPGGSGGSDRAPPGPRAPGSLGHADAVARLVREARAAAALDHPNAVAIFDVGEVGGAPYIAMELVAGRAMRAYVGDPGVPIAMRVRWLHDVARVLAAAHKAALVHRDVKLENVMIRDDGNVKVLDFGIARRIHVDGAPSEMGTITGAGSAVGTPVYMAPEQIRGEGIDGRTDQFAWGVTAYELLSGKMPWRAAAGTFGMIASIVSDDPAPLRDVAPEVPAFVHEIVHRALRKRPEERFPSMDDVAQALEPMLGAPSARLLPQTPQATTSDPMLPFQQTVTTTRELALSASGGHGGLRPRPPWSRRPILLAMAGVAIGLGAVALLHRLSAPTTAAPPYSTATQPPIPPSTPSASPPRLPRDPTAAAEFVAGVQARRDGSERAAYDHFERVVAIDPSFAPALLRVGLIAYGSGEDMGEARQMLERASALRTTLSDEDATLLDAISPCVQRHVVDPGECIVRLGAAAARYPHDAEIAAELSARLFEVGRVDDAITTARRGMAGDPSYSGMEAFLGELEAYAGRWDDALDLLTRCTKRLAGATSCIDYRIWVHTQRDECAAVEADARDWIAAAPHDGGRWGPHHYLANAQIALGRSEAAVRETLEQGWAKTSEAARAETRALDLAALAVLRGDFGEADQDVGELARLAQGDTSIEPHATVAWMRVSLLTEEGRVAEAGQVARTFLEKRESWAPDPRVDDWSIAKDVTMRMNVAAYRARIVDRAELANRRTAWLAHYEPGFGRQGYTWFPAWVDGVTTRDEAADALAAAPADGEPPSHPFTYPEAAIGRMYALLARPKDALDPLGHATKGCFGLEEPFTTVRSHLWLGEAIEASGGAAKDACDEYAFVVARWGGAKPRSVSADEARAHARALGCSR